MALRELLLPWDAQPQDVVPEFGDWAPDWCLHAPMGRVLVPSLGGSTLTTYSGSRVFTPAGSSLSHNGSSDLENWQFADWTPAFPIVIGGVFRVTEISTASQTAVGIGGSAASSGLYGGVGQYTANRVSSWNRTSIAGADAAIDGPTAEVGKVYAVIRIDRSTTDHVMYVNGVMYTSSTNTGSTTGAYRNISIGASVRDTTPIFYGRQDVALGFIGRSAPGDEWARLWSVDPWTLFAPRRIFVPVSAGGGGSWSVSLTESASASDSLGAATTALVSLIESASAADIITAATIAAVALTEAASASDTQTASYSATGSGSVTESASASDTLDAANIMLRALTETASADDQLAAATTMLRAISESASASDAATSSYTAAGAAAIAETASATDALTAAATLLVTILEAGSADDALQAATTMVRAITEQATAVDEVTAALPGSTWDVSIEELAAAVDLITGYAAGGLTASPLGLRLSQGGRIARLTTTARPPRLSTRTR